MIIAMIFNVLHNSPIALFTPPWWWCWFDDVMIIAMIFNILYNSPIALFTPPTWWWWSQWRILDRVFNFAIGICNGNKGRSHEKIHFFVDPSLTITSTIILGHLCAKQKRHKWSWQIMMDFLFAQRHDYENAGLGNVLLHWFDEIIKRILNTPPNK